MSDYFQAMFRRRPNDGWFRAGKYDMTTTDILCSVAILTMFLYGIGRSAFDKLIFAPFAVRDLEIWRLFTWSTATRPNVWLLIGVVFFWLWGQQIESLFGRNRFLIWVATVTIVPAAILTVLGGLSTSFEFASYEFGLSTLFLGLIWVYAATYPSVKFFEVVPMWAAAGVFTLLDLLRFSGDRQTGQIVFLLTVVGVSLVAGRSLGLATGWPIPHIDLAGIGNGSSRSRGSGKRRKATKPKSRGSRGARSSGGSTVVDGPWKNAPAPTAPPTRPSPADQAELDGLLDKIGANGMDALTSTEKKRLNELSKRLRNS